MAAIPRLRRLPQNPPFFGYAPSVVQHVLRYDPAARYDVLSQDVEYLYVGGESLLMTVYRPVGDGPFPMLLRAHGGAWNIGDRAAASLIDTRLAESGMVVAAHDFQLAPDHPYPAQVAQTNFAARWLKAHAGDFNGDASFLGGAGDSSGAHTVLLTAMRPRDPRYSAISADGVGDDASLAFLVALWAIVDPFARYEWAKDAGVERLVRSTESYFRPWDAVHEANPQEMLDRGEDVELPPLLVVQGTADGNIPHRIPQRFAESYAKAGGHAEYEAFPDMPHQFAREPGPETDRAIALIKSFVAWQVDVRRHSE